MKARLAGGGARGGWGCWREDHGRRRRLLKVMSYGLEVQEVELNIEHRTLNIED